MVGDIKKKYIMALKQIQEYSENDLVIIDGERFNLDDELEALTKPQTCPHCGSEKIRLYDASPLDMPEKERAENPDAFGAYGNLDNLMYVYVTCDDCDQTHTLEGEIIYSAGVRLEKAWKEPK